MSWAPVLLTLLTLCTGCGSQPVLHQLLSVFSSPGTTVTLACTVSKDYDMDIHKVHWYQQRLGQAPRRGQNTWYSSISELQAEDEAVYYCAMGPRRSMDKQVEKEKREDKEPAASGSQAPQDTLTWN
ncbi:immunoglobulin iota chain-like [Loxodonta africana]|uniref:immunoglobulin iota chain-like n=1 Tax=Loxodonta africana TaxID=9785 RepID=UPI0030CAA042